MRFLPSKQSKKTILVISDLHLAGGVYLDQKRNPFESFKSDKELVDFFNYFSTGKYSSKEVEIIINGDFLDFLAVPNVDFFDDEYWSEEASIEKLKIILSAHTEVFESISLFLENKNKKIVYQLGNHDSELLFPKVRFYFLNQLSIKAQAGFIFHINPSNTYIPEKGVYIKHGHEYEIAHVYDTEASIAKNEEGRLFFLPSWGSYYVVKLINKFKQERNYIDSVHPIKNFLINGLIYDTLLTLRFMLANVYYFIMVRVILYFKKVKNYKDLLSNLKNELSLFQDYEDLTFEYMQEVDDLDILVVGHTHKATIMNYENGKTFVNTGTWVKMNFLDFGRSTGLNLTFAQIELFKNKDGEQKEVYLNRWKGNTQEPYYEYDSTSR